MTLRLRRASSILLSGLCVLASDRAVSSAGSQKVPSAQDQSPSQPPPSVRPRMREHFTRGAAIRDAVVRGDLEAARSSAQWIAEHPQQDLPPSALPHIGDVQRLAGEVAAAPDLSQAALGLARLSAACGACHTAVGATPTLMAALPRGEDNTVAGRMRKHYRAADLLYRGLVVPSTHSWNAGAEALSADPSTLDLTRGTAPRPEIATLTQRLHDLAGQARTAEDPKTRVEVYARMLETCSECHTRQGVHIDAGPPRD